MASNKNLTPNEIGLVAWLRIGLPLVRFFAVAVNFVTGTMMNYCFVVLVAKVDLHLADRVQR